MKKFLHALAAGPKKLIGTVAAGQKKSLCAAAISPKKSLCALAAGMLLCLPAKAQQASPNHLYVGAGDAVIYTVAYALASAFGSIISVPSSNKSVELVQFGSYALSYERDLGSGRFALGGTLAAMPIRQRFIDVDTHEVSGSELNCVTYALASGSINYCLRKKFHLYTQLQLGANYNSSLSSGSSSSGGTGSSSSGGTGSSGSDGTGSSGSDGTGSSPVNLRSAATDSGATDSGASTSGTDTSPVNFAYQVNIIGARFGQGPVGGYLALGFGHLGLLNAGLSFNF